MPYPTPSPPASNGPGTCPHCLARVLWCLTDANRKPLAVDPAEDTTGNQAVRVDTEGTYWTRQLSKARPAVEQREVLRRPHFASCPTAQARAAAARRRTPGRARTGVRPVRWQR
ncbi:hypothetical protein ACFYQA_17410 [Streptomyces sp. NPDC005774]|uniref:hypothetical protein n=1 Tax=Streptomyces sp. NPDC005774 TaxID=3364728 RepID=UPI00369C91B1